MRIALVVQRYGKEVIGGAERLARELAGHLVKRHQIEVLTTCAKEHFSWANHFNEGARREEGVTVRRFPVTRTRNWARFGQWSRVLFAVNSRWSLPAWLGKRWVIQQGPFVPNLVDYLNTNSDRFDLVIFFTYLYYPTVFGLPSVASKSVLVPTAHNEPAIQFKVFEDVFRLPRYLIFLTREEEELVCSLFGDGEVRHQTIGMGITLRKPSTEDRGYFFYAGRVESGKNCELMFEYCQRAGVSLKVAGPTRIQVPDSVEYLGQIPEEEKEELLANCRAVIVPSAMESLSISALEAWAHGKPVVAWEKSSVLKGQINRSGGGYSFGDFAGFLRITRSLDSRRGLRGWEYVKQNYSWDTILPKYEAVFESVAREALR